MRKSQYNFYLLGVRVLPSDTFVFALTISVEFKGDALTKYIARMRCTCLCPTYKMVP